jgi:hypothetical protein
MIRSSLGLALALLALLNTITCQVGAGFVSPTNIVVDKS